MGEPVPPHPPGPPAPPWECHEYIEPYFIRQRSYAYWPEACEEFPCMEACIWSVPPIVNFMIAECPSCTFAWYILNRCECELHPEGPFTLYTCYWDFFGCSDYIDDVPSFGPLSASLAYTLAIEYGFSPLPDGKFEPDRLFGADERTFLFANWRDHTNVLIKFRPDELE